MNKEEKKARTWGLTCRIFIYLLIFLCTNIPSYAQSLKTYSGEYKYGKAIYTYRDNPEGGRIYEGKFTYSYSFEAIGGLASGSATGYFKNNKKEGAWTYQSGNTVLKVTYKEGVLDGLYDLFTRTPTGRKDVLSVRIKGNKFVGPIKGTRAAYYWSQSVLTSVDFTGQFDENGNFDGKWVFKDRNGRLVYTAIYEHGICKKYYQEDLTTGDIEHDKGNISLYLKETIDRNFKQLELMVDRESKAWRWDAPDENCHQDVAEENMQGEATPEDEVFDMVENNPEFPGGFSEMMKFISESINYPAEAEEIQGRVTVTFVVNKDGSISDVKVVRGVHEALDKEAVRVIKSMPKWKPAMHHGKNVRARYTVPVMFRLQ